MKSNTLKSETAMPPLPKRKRLRVGKRAWERFGPGSYEGFREAVRKLREDYDPGYGEFVRSIRKSHCCSCLPPPDDSK